jgi:hypothetical protein
MGLTGKYLLGTYSAILAIDALIGFYVLYNVYTNDKDNGISE